MPAFMLDCDEKPLKERMFPIGIDFDGVVGSLADYLEGGDQYFPWLEALAQEDKERAALGHANISCVEHAESHWRKHVDKTCPIYLRAVPGALEGLRFLKDRGHDLFIATWRTPEGVEHARLWLLDHGLEIPVVSTERDKTKLVALQRRNALVHFDDVPEMLEDLHPHIPHRFLLNWHYNADSPVSNGITRVFSWEEFIGHVLKIKVS